ncbi:MAG: phosphotransferase [Chloroflexi bacterium]|nr:phosphotransferase [Chloroflexota bacterium]
MSDSDYNDKLDALVRSINPRYKLLRTWQFTGGVSAQVTALEIEQPDGHRQKMIVRRHGEVDRKQNPLIAADEFKLLQLLRSQGLAVPTPYYFDQSCESLSLPYLVIEYIEGETDFCPSNLADYIYQLATHLAKFHRVLESQFDLSFLPKQGNGFVERPEKFDESLHEGRIRETLTAMWPLPQINESVLLHGDFWPGNVLWVEGRLAAVIDWEDATVGDPLADVANSRLEILWAFGKDAMHRFTDHYQSMTTIDLTNLPYWDLCAALRPASKIGQWGLTPSTEKAMRAEHRWFVDQVLEKLNEVG